MISKNDVKELYPENLEDVSGGVIRDRTDVFPYECYDENTGEHIGSCWSRGIMQEQVLFHEPYPGRTGSAASAAYEKTEIQKQEKKQLN